DWHAWWSTDLSVRSVLKMFTHSPEETRGLPTPDQFVNKDYANGILKDEHGRPFVARQFAPLETGAALGAILSSGKA
ncbi:unnamed protein product, partial [Polarella glacialis]